MAIYHLSIKIISRGKGKSAVATSAYRSGEKIKNEYDGIVHDFTRKEGIDHTEIILTQNAPQEFSDRGILWNSVEKIEKSKNSQLAREIEAALPKELSRRKIFYEKGLNNAINKFILKDDIITYRGTNEKYYKTYKVGDVFEGKVFYSTSLGYEQAKVFADDVTEYDEDGYKGLLLEIKVPKNSKALYVGGNTDYKDGNYIVNEYELLLSNKVKYKIEKMEKVKLFWRLLALKIKELVMKAYRGEEISRSDMGEVFFYLRHIPNIKKTDEEFELYCKMAKEKGLPKPDRNSYVRPLHEKH